MPILQNRRGLLWPVVAVVLACAGLSSTAHAYSNQRPDTISEGGPHRVINELAIKRFVVLCQDGDPRKEYLGTTPYTLFGPRVVAVSKYISDPREERRPLTWREWIIDGGFSADEPELYNSFRHFYDPLKWHPDRPMNAWELMRLDPNEEIQGVHYLTDHLKQIHTLLSYSVPGQGFNWYANVRVNAKDWAITGEPGDGTYANRYSWQAGQKYFKVAFEGVYAGKPLAPGQRETAYAKAYRALGETMHLLADMTCVPHVRNDSHPGLAMFKGMEDYTGPNFGVLKNDPYELYCQDDLIRKLVPKPAKLDVILDKDLETINETNNLGDLFHMVALFTNRHFFSADTIPFRLEVEGKILPVLVSANECRAYPEPSFSIFDHDLATERRWQGTIAIGDTRYFAAANDQEGYYHGMVWDEDVKLCHRSWLSFIGWAGHRDAQKITTTCVESQAKLLLPLAVASNARLLDLFIPKIEVVVNEVNLDTGKLHGAIRHLPYGVFPDELVYNDLKPVCQIRIGDHVQKLAGGVTVKRGVIEADIGGLGIQPGNLVVLEMDVAGFRIPSPPCEAVIFSRDEPKEPTPPELVELDHLGFTLGVTGIANEHTPGLPPQERYLWLTIGCEHMIESIPPIKIYWNGTSFKGSASDDDKLYHISFSGAFDKDLKELVTFEAKCAHNNARAIQVHQGTFGKPSTPRGVNEVWSFSAKNVPVKGVSKHGIEATVQGEDTGKHILLPKIKFTDPRPDPNLVKAGVPTTETFDTLKWEYNAGFHVIITPKPR